MVACMLIDYIFVAELLDFKMVTNIAKKLQRINI